MEVTKDEQRKLDDLFRKIADRDEFVAQQRQAAETLRRKEAEPPVTVWAVVDNYTLRDWGQEGFNICGIYLTLDEAVAHIHAERESHKGEGPLMPIEGKGENTRWDYSDWDTAHNYGIEQAPILSTFLSMRKNPNIELIQRSWYLEGYRDGAAGNGPMWIIKTGDGGPCYERNEKYQPIKDGQQPEVDLSQEIEKYYYDNFAFISSAHNPTKDIVGEIAKHFYELGRKASNEQIKGKEYALTLEQVARLDYIIMDMVGKCYNDGYKTRPFYEEVLRRFNRKEGQR